MPRATTMLNEPSERLSGLRGDYEAVTGAPFRHFFCPILYRDEDIELCEAHIVNGAFTDSPKATTIQRKDIDPAFGYNLSPRCRKWRLKFLSLAANCKGEHEIS